MIDLWGISNPYNVTRPQWIKSTMVLVKQIQFFSQYIYPVISYKQKFAGLPTLYSLCQQYLHTGYSVFLHPIT